jgi:putative membrane protein
MTDFNPGYLLNAIVYSVLGIIIFSLSFVIIDKMTPYDLWREICENRNTALAIMVGAMSIGVCIIIAAAVH